MADIGIKIAKNGDALSLPEKELSLTSSRNNLKMPGAQHIALTTVFNPISSLYEAVEVIPHGRLFIPEYMVFISIGGSMYLLPFADFSVAQFLSIAYTNVTDLVIELVTLSAQTVDFYYYLSETEGAA